MPYLVRPVTFAGMSMRGGAVPIRRNSLRFFKVTFVGALCSAAACTSSP